MKNIGIVSYIFIALLVSAAGRAAAGEAEKLNLIDALTEAQSSNYSITAAESRLLAAEAGIRESRGSLFPGLSVMADYSLYENPALVNPMNEAPGPQSTLLFDDRIYTTMVRLEIPVFNLPAFAAVEGAKALAESKQFQKIEIEQSVLAKVTEVFIQARQIEDSIAMVESHIRALEKRHEELQQLGIEGRVKPANIAVVEASIFRARSDLYELETIKAELAIRLGVLLGRKDPAVPASTALSSPLIEEPGYTGGPLLQQAAAQIAGAEAQKKAVLYSFAPRVSGFAAQTARSGSDIDFNGEWSAGITVTVPVITGGERLAKLRSAKAGMESAKDLYQAAVQQEYSSLKTAYERWKTTGLRRDLLGQAVEKQQISVRGFEDLYREGRIPLSELLSEENTLLELKMQERRLLYDQLLSFVSYHQTAGSLTPSLLKSIIKE